MHIVGPVRSKERISSLGTTRGFALLGILAMNIVGFGLPFAYDDPTNCGGATGANLWVWIAMHILAEAKTRCLFSMVFGAGIILLTARAERRADSSSAADIYYRRNLWLGALGIPHAFLLWQGKIPYPYALCALALYPFRRMAPKGLILIFDFTLSNGMDTQKVIAEGKAAEGIKKIGTALSAEQESSLRKWEDLRKQAKPTAAEIEQTDKKWRGSVIDVITIRAEGVWRWRNSYTASTRVAGNFDIVVNTYAGAT